jgi:hypothetical protein
MRTTQPFDLDLLVTVNIISGVLSEVIQNWPSKLTHYPPARASFFLALRLSGSTTESSRQITGFWL